MKTAASVIVFIVAGNQKQTLCACLPDLLIDGWNSAQMNNTLQPAVYVIPLTLLHAIGLTHEKGWCRLSAEAS